MTRAHDRRLTRRQFTLAAGAALSSVAVGEACLVATNRSPASDGRLTARPGAGAATSLKTGALGLRGDRDGVIQKPSAARGETGPRGGVPHSGPQRGAGPPPRGGPARAPA